MGLAVLNHILKINRCGRDHFFNGFAAGQCPHGFNVFVHDGRDLSGGNIRSAIAFGMDTHIH